MKQFTQEERIRRVWDKEEAKTVLAKNAYYMSANRRAQALEELWVQDPEHQKTASYGKNWGYYVGMDEIKTKTMRGFLAGIGAGKSVVITPEVDEIVVKSARNIPGVVTTTAKILSVYDIVNAGKFIVDKAALAVIEEVFA